MTELALLRNPRKSHRKPIKLPPHSMWLAEFMGIMIGDGGLNNPWQATITLNASKDAQYAAYVESLIEGLFGVKPAIRKRKNRDALVISAASITLVDFLISQGLRRGNKLEQGLNIPKWILRNQDFRKACVRGLIDTDGCLFIHQHMVARKRYKNIGLCFTSHSPRLLEQVAGIFEEFGIMPHSSTKRRDIYLYRADAVAKYLRIFGTSNERIASVYKKWRDG